MRAIVGARARAGSGGFTLIEVLVSLAVVALIGVGVTSLGFAGVIGIRDTASEATDGAVDAQLLGMLFARDVQGSAGVGPACKAPEDSALVLGLTDGSDGGGAEYRYAKRDGGTGELVRVVCDPGGGVRGTQVVAGDLRASPSVRCDDSECIDGTSPRRVRLMVVLADWEVIELLGTRRSGEPEPAPTTTTTSTTTTSTTTTTTTTPPPPLRMPTFLALAGSGTPLQLSGSSTFVVAGDALFNFAGSGAGIVATGNPRIRVAGEFGLQAPGTCSGCDKFADKLPNPYADSVADPLGALPTPDPTGMPERSGCAPTGRTAICSPGVYTSVFPSAPNGIGDFLLEPGVYVLRGGMSMSWGTLSGEGVMLYTENGSVNLGGSSVVKLTPPLEGPYAGVSVFQERGRASSMAVSGNASLVAPGGMLYGANQHLAVSGSAQVAATRIVTSSVAMSGNVKVSAGES